MTLSTRNTSGSKSRLPSGTLQPVEGPLRGRETRTPSQNPVPFHTPKKPRGTEVLVKHYQKRVLTAQVSGTRWGHRGVSEPKDDVTMLPSNHRHCESTNFKSTNPPPPQDTRSSSPKNKRADCPVLPDGASATVAEHLEEAFCCLLHVNSLVCDGT